MDQSQIREIVKITLDELAQRNMLKDPYQDILKAVDKYLCDYFNNKAEGNGVSYALRQLLDDPYIDLIYLHYRDKRTIEDIAEYYEKDTSTILRNKKRLVKSIYEMIRDV